jgi:hypothetical protein
MSVDAYICGCSFSTGYYRSNDNPHEDGYHQPYFEFFCNAKNLSFTNLAFNGASNYAIIKQAQYAIRKRPKIILINLTTEFRFDYTDPDFCLVDRPALKDFIFNTRKENPANEGNTPCIHSLPFSSIVLKNDRVFNEFVATYDDLYIRADYFRLMLSGMFRELEESGIPHVIVNHSPAYIEGFSKKIFHYDSADMVSKFPEPKDPKHWNSNGHKYIGKLLELNVKVNI